MEDQIKLMKIQLELDRELGVEKFYGSSLSDTIYWCILEGQDKRAHKLKSEFKVPDTRYWWIRIKALAERRRWDDLEKFANSKKSPIGYKV